MPRRVVARLVTCHLHWAGETLVITAMAPGVGRRASCVSVPVGLAWLAVACSGSVSQPGPDHGDGAGAPTAGGAAVEAALACGPTGGGPYWVEEGDSVTVAIACSTGLALPGDAFTLTNLPADAAYDATSARLTWKTSLSDAAVYLVPVTALGEVGEI